MPGENEDEDTLAGGEDTVAGGAENTNQDSVAGNQESGFISDEDFLKLSPEEFNARMAGTQVNNQGGSDADNAGAIEGEQAAADSASGVQPTGEQAPAAGQGIQTQTPAQAEPPKGGQTQQPQGQQPAPTTKKTEEPAKKQETPASTLPAGVTQEQVNDFFKKLTGPIKADGREITVRSADDAVRLIQMGYNYSRRMEELKPIKALSAMLEANGLRDEGKLNFLIDLSKGKPEAIQKLLADHKIDALDLDPTKANTYTPQNHAVNPKDLAFREAIDATMAAEGGRELITDINASWDIESKSALREQPLIFQNLLAQMQSGVYVKIKTEMDYQKSLGYLTGVPFLQAYHQVGTAMQNAGVFNTPTPTTQVQATDPGAGSVNQQQPAPIATGTRKAPAQTKTAQPAPNVSSVAQPRVISNRPSDPIPQDYAGMSDAEFRKLPPPR